MRSRPVPCLFKCEQDSVAKFSFGLTCDAEVPHEVVSQPDQTAPVNLITRVKATDVAERHSDEKIMQFIDNIPVRKGPGGQPIQFMQSAGQKSQNTQRCDQVPGRRDLPAIP